MIKEKYPFEVGDKLRITRNDGTVITDKFVVWLAKFLVTDKFRVPLKEIRSIELFIVKKEKDKK